jgi:hypothetical protein
MKKKIKIKNNTYIIIPFEEASFYGCCYFKDALYLKNIKTGLVMTYFEKKKR